MTKTSRTWNYVFTKSQKPFCNLFVILPCWLYSWHSANHAGFCIFTKSQKLKRTTKIAFSRSAEKCIALPRWIIPWHGAKSGCSGFCVFTNSQKVYSTRCNIYNLKLRQDFGLKVTWSLLNFWLFLSARYFSLLGLVEFMV